MGAQVWQSVAGCATIKTFSSENIGFTLQFSETKAVLSNSWVLLGLETRPLFQKEGAAGLSHAAAWEPEQHTTGSYFLPSCGANTKLNRPLTPNVLTFTVSVQLDSGLGWDVTVFTTSLHYNCNVEKNGGKVNIVHLWIPSQDHTRTWVKKI